MKIGDTAFYKSYAVKIVRGSYPRAGDKRVVVEREYDGRRFTVAVKYLRPVSRLETTSATIAAAKG